MTRMGKVTKLRTPPELRRAHRLLEEIDAANVAHMMLAILAHRPLTSPMLHDMLWTFGVPQGDYRDVLMGLLKQDAIEDGGGDEAEVVFRLTKSMQQVMRERARDQLKAAPAKPQTDVDVDGVYRDLRQQVDYLRAEIGRLEAKRIETRELREILKDLTSDTEILGELVGSDAK